MHSRLRLPVAALLALAAGCAKGEAVRIATFNVQFLPGSHEGDCSVLPPGVPCDPAGFVRAGRIAERLKAADYDFFALNEVFDEEAREQFVEALKGEYPNYVAYLGDDAVGTEDSGLMLFSRFPFEALPFSTWRAESDDVTARNQGADWKEVAFVEFDYDVFPDNWAAKGCGLVRMRNPETNRVYNVAFTHMQASYPEDEDDQADWLEPIAARFGQLLQIQRMLEETLYSHSFTREDILLLGDMNIDGDLADPNLGVAGYDRPNLWEWAQAFDRAGSFFTSAMMDSWAFEHSSKDRGLTNFYHWGPQYVPEPGARLDYVLRNRRRDDTLCVQHLTLAHNLRWGEPYIESGVGLAGVTELSDHIGLNAELNVRTPNCDPAGALVNPPQNVWASRALDNPGQAKWLRFDEPGTYAFASRGAGADFRIYAAQDLSTPVPQYFEETLTFTTRKGEVVQGKKFINPSPPLYVKLFMSPRTLTGGHEFVSHRATCATREEACVLRASEIATHAMPGVPVQPDDSAWFEIRTEAADSGRKQDLAFEVDDFNPAGGIKIELYREDGTTLVDYDAEAEPDPFHPGKFLLKIYRDDLPPQASKYYLVVRRSDLGLTSFQVGWRTDLAILHGQSVGVPGATAVNVFCVEETDSIGIDEVYLTVAADGVTLVDDVYIGDFDDGVYRSLEDLIGAIRFVDDVKVTLREEDGAANGDDDYLETTIHGLPFGESELLGQSATLACCDGKYLFRHNLSKNLQKAY